MDIRGERIWCADCTAPTVPRDQLPYIELFLAALPAWRVNSELSPALMEGFDRAQVSAQIDLTPLPCSREQAWEALLHMERVFRVIRSEQAEDKKSQASAPGNPETPVGRRKPLMIEADAS